MNTVTDDADTVVVKMSGQEQGVVINALNQMRNGLLQKGRHTDAVDDMLLKVIDARPQRRGLMARLRGRDEAR